MRPVVFSILAMVSCLAFGQDDGPIRVLSQVPKGPFYVGQAVPLHVSVIAGKERPTIIPPRVADADVELVGTDLKPISASGIGEMVNELNRFVFRFRVVPRRSGTLEIPPVVARVGERSGTGRLIRLTVQAPPIEGRPGGFLGGIGAFEVAAGAIPAVVRAGQDLEYWIRVTGPAALGMTGTPDLSRLERLPIGLQVEPGKSELVANPPSRTFRFRIRPNRAGEAVLPPVRIAAFDPSIGRYVTKASPGVPVRVADVPRFDPSDLQYTEPPSIPVGSSWPSSLAGLAVTIVAILALLRVLRRFHPRFSAVRSARSIASRTARSIQIAHDAPEVAELAVNGLSSYLQLVIDHPPGALTPDEAGRGIEKATGRGDLAARAVRLVAECDRARFADDPPPAGALAAEAKPFFEELGKARVGRKPEKPREAAATADH